MKTQTQQRPHGFLLMEMVLALAVFSMAATGFVVALHRMSEAASVAQTEMRITRVLESALDETMSLPVLEPGESAYDLGDTGIQIRALIEPLEDLETEEGTPLQEMYRIVITAEWYEDGQRKQREVETWRYGLMYQS